MGIAITRRGYIRLLRDGVQISQHTVAEEAYERAIAHAAEHGDGKYLVTYPDREIDVNLLMLSRVRGGAVVSGGGGGDEPTPSGNILFDTRAGGAEDYQTTTTIDQMQGRWDALRNTTASQFYSGDVDGTGTKARGCQWANATGSEQEAMVDTESVRTVAPASGWYTQFKMRLGRSSTGGGSGTVGQFSLTGGNPHQKTFIWTRANGDHRVYIAMRPSETKLSIDGLNYNSPDWDENPYDYPGENQTITVYLQPTGGVVRAWRNGTLILDASGQDIGNSVLNDIQETVTTFPAQQQVQYMWDTVVWYP